MAYKRLIRVSDLDPVMGLTTSGWSGVRWDPSLPGTAMTRVGDLSWPQIFYDISVVTLSDSGVVNATIASYLSPTLTGSLDGSSGQIMVSIPRKYYREIFNTSGELCGIDMSNLPLPGFRLHEKFSWGNGRGEVYVGVYEGSTGAGKLQSISGVALEHSKTLAEFRTLATARGAGWHAYDFYTQHLLQMLLYLQFADLNSQGMAIPGYTEHTWTDGHEKRLTGRMNSCIQMNGYANAEESGIDADLVGGWLNSSRVIANRFCWVENLYGHCWKFLDGVSFDGRIGKPNTAYVTPNPTLFSSVEANILSKYFNLNVDMPVAGDAGYVKSFNSLFIPKAFGGDSASYVTDYFWSYLDNASYNYLRVVFSGGSLADGALAGVAARLSLGDFGLAYSSYVSRLCYESN